MLRPRIIPFLLISDGGLVKTVRFANPTYVGDPINAVKIFNEKECDELAVLDIDASVKRQAPDFRRIGHLAAECRMPLCYGGGIKTADDAKRVVELGVEKVAVSSAAVERPETIASIAKAVGNQSVVVVLDVRPVGGDRYQIWTHNGTRPTGRPLEQGIREAEAHGAGEIVVNAIERDGTMKGYDIGLAEQVRSTTRLPITMVGGAGSTDHLSQLIDACGVVGAGAGSLFVFKGAYRAVLINYPNQAQKDALIGRLARTA